MTYCNNVNMEWNKSKKSLDAFTMYLLLLYPLLGSSFLFYRFIDMGYVRLAILSMMTFLVVLRILRSNKVSAVNLLWILCVFTWMVLTVDNFIIAFQYLPYFLMLLVVTTEDDWDILRKFIMFSGIFCSVGIFFQLLFPSLFHSIVLPQFQNYSQFDKLEDTFTERISYFGFVSDTSVAARYIAFSIAYLVISLYTQKKVKKVPTLVWIIFFGIAILLTGKRTYVGGLVISLLIIYFVSAQVSKKIKRIVAFALVLSIFSFTLPIIAELNNIPAISRLLAVFDTISSGEDFLGYRSILFEKAITFFKENPVFGIGWRQYRNSVQNYAGYSLNVHNIYLQLLCEFGVVGLIVFGFFFIKEYYRTKKLLKQKHIEFDFALMLLFIQGYFLVCGIIENELYVATGFAYYFISCALARKNISKPILK